MVFESYNKINYIYRSLTFAWRITPDADATSPDKWCHITKTHNRWVRVGVKTYENS